MALRTEAASKCIAPIPSASALTGTVPYSLASSLIAKQHAPEDINKAKRTPDVSLVPIKPSNTPSRPSTPLPTKEERLSPLMAAASKHAQSLGLGNGAQRPLTAQRAVAKEEAQRLLERLKDLSSKAGRHSKDKGLDEGLDAKLPTEALHEHSDAVRPLTPSLRPSLALSSREFTLPRPSSSGSLGRDVGPLVPGSSSRPQSPRAATPGTPRRPLSRLGSNPLRSSLPAMLTAGNHPMTPWQSSTRVVAAADQDPAPSSDIWINPSAAAAASTAVSCLQTTTRDKSYDRGGRFVSTKKVEDLTGRKNRIEHFDMTRGSLFAVFTDLDSCKEGRITRSMFAEAGVLIGMHASKIDEMYSSLDAKGQGFVSLQEWGSREMEPQVRAFSKLYLQVTRGPSGKIEDEPISDLHSALAYAMGKLSIRETGRISRMSHRKVLETFSFIDVNKSNTIDEQELADAFMAMGVNVTDDVIAEAMRTFDKDQSGQIDYLEFLTILFPGLVNRSC